MYNGHIIKASREIVEGSHKQGGWSDHWDESYDVVYDGELTDDVCAAIVAAFKASPLFSRNSGSSWGALRWPLADENVRVDRESRKVLVQRGSGMCD